MKFLEAISNFGILGFPLVLIYKKEIDSKSLQDVVQYANRLKHYKSGTVLIRGLEAKLEMRKSGGNEKVCVAGRLTIEFKTSVDVPVETLGESKSVRLEQRERLNMHLIISPYHKSAALIFIFTSSHAMQEKFPQYSMIETSEFNIRTILAHAEAQRKGFCLLSVIKEELDGILKSLVDVISP